MNKYLEEGLNKSEYIFCSLIIIRWSVGFTKPISHTEIFILLEFSVIIHHVYYMIL